MRMLSPRASLWLSTGLGKSVSKSDWLPLTGRCTGVNCLCAATTTTSGPLATTTERLGQRPVSRSDFAVEELLTAQLSAMSDSERADLGYSVNEMILDCQFAGSTCKPRSSFQAQLCPRFILYCLYFTIYLLSLQQWVTSIDGYIPFWPPAYVTVLLYSSCVLLLLAK